MIAFRSASGSASEHAQHAFGLTIAASDTEPLRLALDGGFSSQDGIGEVEGPIESPWSLGVVRFRNIGYKFETNISQLELTDGGIAVTAKLRHFSGTVKRVEFNQSGTSYCKDLPVSSDNNDVNIKVVLNPRINSNGDLHLQVKSSEISLNETNFNVGRPSSCNVLSGFNWLVRWLLPQISESYRDVIATKVGALVAKGLEETGLAYSPYFFFNVTLPVERDPFRPFFARIGVTPQDITIDRSHFSTWFSSDIEIDPDQQTDLLQLDSGKNWPESKSHLAFSWDFLNSVLKEANFKGVIAGELKKTRRTATLFDATTLEHIWPGFSKIPDLFQDIRYELGGAEALVWTMGDSARLASLNIKGLHLRLMNGTNLVAKLDMDFHISISVNVTPKVKSRFSAVTEKLRFDRVSIDPTEGLMGGKPFDEKGLTELAKLIERVIHSAPRSDRQFIDFSIPELHIGSHNIHISDAEFHGKGLLFPITLETLEK